MLVYDQPMTTFYSKFTSYTKVALDIIYNCVDIIYSRVAKNRGARERGFHEVKTSRTNCDPSCARAGFPRSEDKSHEL